MICYHWPFRHLSQCDMKLTSSQHKDILLWDMNAWSAPLAWWNENMNGVATSTCLELGGREGGLSLWLALGGHLVICSDLEDAEAIAKPLHFKHGMHSVRYMDIDATNIPFENHFDVIVFKSIIGGIGRVDEKWQQVVFDQIYKALKPGGRLMFAENLSASPLHKWLRRKFVRWGASWRYVSMEQLKMFSSAFSESELRATGFLSAFGRTERQRNFLNFFDRICFNHIVPDRWKYIGYGIVTK